MESFPQNLKEKAKSAYTISKDGATIWWIDEDKALEKLCNGTWAQASYQFEIVLRITF